MDFPDPVIGIAVEPKTQKDLDKLGVGLQKLAEEDPTFRVATNEETGQTVISGITGKHTVLHRICETFLDGRDEFLGNITALHLVYKLEAAVKTFVNPKKAWATLSPTLTSVVAR
mgnify:CR=1 FL=1